MVRLGSWNLLQHLIERFVPSRCFDGSSTCACDVVGHPPHESTESVFIGEPSEWLRSKEAQKHLLRGILSQIAAAPKSSIRHGDDERPQPRIQSFPTRLVEGLALEARENRLDIRRRVGLQRNALTVPSTARRSAYSGYIAF